mmetsp:Transcript_43585/g.98050  ORF Transcript_43585/g.98050 Transcript_43585/m.98050 type:complete len:205 (+) Transcript_43585:177-791(+)
MRRSLVRPPARGAGPLLHLAVTSQPPAVSSAQGLPAPQRLGVSPGRPKRTTQRVPARQTPCPQPARKVREGGCRLAQLRPPMRSGHLVSNHLCGRQLHPPVTQQDANTAARCRRYPRCHRPGPRQHLLRARRGRGRSWVTRTRVTRLGRVTRSRGTSRRRRRRQRRSSPQKRGATFGSRAGILRGRPALRAALAVSLALKLTRF